MKFVGMVAPGDWCAVECLCWSSWLDDRSFGMIALLDQGAWSRFDGESSTFARGELPVRIDLENLLVPPTSAGTSNDRAVATSNEEWVRGRFVGDSEAYANFERACCGGIQRGMGARTKENDWLGSDDLICCAKFGWGGGAVSPNPNELYVERECSAQVRLNIQINSSHHVNLVVLSMKSLAWNG